MLTVHRNGYIELNAVRLLGSEDAPDVPEVLFINITYIAAVIEDSIGGRLHFQSGFNMLSRKISRQNAKAIKKLMAGEK